jgi:hypothetical protein
MPYNVSLSFFISVITPHIPAKYILEIHCLPLVFVIVLPVSTMNPLFSTLSTVYWGATPCIIRILFIAQKFYHVATICSRFGKMVGDLRQRGKERRWCCFAEGLSMLLHIMKILLVSVEFRRAK